MELILRKAKEKDIEEVASLEELCIREPWSKESIKKDILENEDALWIVAELKLEKPKVVGYIGIWKIQDEGQIMNVAVDPVYRGNNIGSDLIDTMIDVTSKEGITRWSLEVRKSNYIAIKLYEKFDFKALGVRKGYYLDNGEDAIIMWKFLETSIN